MCQYGAAAMAENNAKHQKILSHYYPDTTIETLYKVAK
jgi:SpoIID/LytB domain protein